MAVSIVMPRLGDFMTEGTVTAWAKSSGDEVKQGEVLAEIETEKVNYDLEATDSGIFHPVVDEGATVPVDGLLGYLLAQGETPPEASTPQPAAVSAPQAGAPPRPASARAPGEVVPSTPGARRLAANLSVEIAKVTPTGPRGRVVEADVRLFAEDRETAPQPAAPAGLPTPSRSVPIQGIRKAIADHMRRSISSTAQLTFALEVDVTEAQRLRRDVSKGREQAVALAHVLIKACAEALKRVPLLNTVLSDGNILHFDEINIGVAVALKEGLIVPVLSNVESKDIYQVSKETAELGSSARNGKLSTDEVVGGTFTISVLGSVDAFTPILSQGQSAILGVGRSVEKPVARDGEIAIREMMTLSLTVDHQVIDGAVAAGFLRRLQQLIERPAPLFK